MVAAVAVATSFGILWASVSHAEMPADPEANSLEVPPEVVPLEPSSPSLSPLLVEAQTRLFAELQLAGLAEYAVLTVGEASVTDRTQCPRVDVALRETAEELMARVVLARARDCLEMQRDFVLPSTPGAPEAMSIHVVGWVAEHIKGTSFEAPAAPKLAPEKPRAARVATPPKPPPEPLRWSLGVQGAALTGTGSVAWGPALTLEYAVFQRLRFQLQTVPLTTSARTPLPGVAVERRFVTLGAVVHWLQSARFALFGELSAGPLQVSATGQHEPPLANRTDRAVSLASSAGLGAVAHVSSGFSLQAAVTAIVAAPAFSVSVVKQEQDLGQPMWVLRLGPQGHF